MASVVTGMYLGDSAGERPRAGLRRRPGLDKPIGPAVPE